MGLPTRTELNNGSGKRIPKEKFYSRLELTNNQERIFVDQIQSIRWMNKISPDSMNLSLSNGIQEIEVFEIVLKGIDVDEKLLKVIDNAIVHPILFVLKEEGKECVRMAFKELDAGGKTVVKQYYSIDWRLENTIKLDFSGLSTGELYKNLIVQLSSGRISDPVDDSDLSNLVADDIEYQKALNEMQKLENNIKKTSQPNKKLELVHQLRDLKKKWGVE